MKRLLSLALVVMLVLSLFTACGGDGAGTNPGGEAAPAAPSGEKDSVIVAMNADPTGFDPQVTLDATAMMVMYNIYDTLVESDGACSSDIRPGLAESWDISDDNMVYTFHLKSGVKFHNGEPFTAADAKFTIERAMVEPATASYCASIDKVDAPDDSTLVVTLKVPFANFLMNLGGSFFGVVNEKAVTESGEDYGRNPVGTGPYKFVSWSSGDNVVLAYNEDYHGEAPAVKNVTYRVLPDTSTALVALQNGEIDALPNSAPIDAPTIEADPNLNLYSAPGATIAYIGFNTQAAPFDNEKVRQAVKYAINKEEVFMGAQDGDGVLANSPLNEVMDGYNPDDPVMNPYDLKKAKALMTEAGYADGFSCSIKLAAGQNREKVAQVVQAQLKEIGITASIETLEKGTYFEQMAVGNYEVYVGGLNWPDADDMLTYLFASDGPFNWGSVYSNPTIDELLVKARQENDAAKRSEMYQQIVKITDEDANKIPLYFPNQYFAAKNSLKGVRVIDNCYYPVASWSWE